MPKKIVVKDHQIGYLKKGGELHALANFGVTLERQEGYSDDLPDNLLPSHYKGFIVRVTHKRKRHGEVTVNEG